MSEKTENKATLGTGTWNDEEWTIYDTEATSLPAAAARGCTTKKNYHLAVVLTKIEYLAAKMAFQDAASPDSVEIIKEMIERMKDQAGDPYGFLAKLQSDIVANQPTGWTLSLRQDTKGKNHIEYFFEITKPKQKKAQQPKQRAN